MIFVECDPDACLIGTLTSISKRQISHEFRGVGGVCGRLLLRTDSTGLVDEDQGSPRPRYLRECSTDHGIDVQKLGLQRLVDSARNNVVLVLCPNLESWFLDAANEAGVQLTTHGLPENFADLHDNLDLDKFRLVVHTLVKKGSPRILQLKDLLLDELPKHSDAHIG